MNLTQVTITEKETYNSDTKVWSTTNTLIAENCPAGTPLSNWLKKVIHDIFSQENGLVNVGEGVGTVDRRKITAIAIDTDAASISVI